MTDPPESGAFGTKSTFASAAAPADSAADPYIGCELDRRYRVLARIGVGGMSVVYRAVQLPIGREVALKVLRPDRQHDERQVRQFEAEARMAGAIDHPNAVTVHDAGRLSDGTHFLAMELIEGQNLRAVLETEGVLGEARVREIGRQVADALAEAHRRGFVHSDIKPENVMIEKDRMGHPNWVKVLDFGIAVPVGAPGATSSAAAPGLLVGTPRYMSPEQCRGEALDPRSDVYSAGVVMYEMLVGEPPFHGGNMTTRGQRASGTGRLGFGSAVSVMAKHVQGGVPALRDRRPDLQLSREFEKLIMRALSKEPNWRFRDGAELVDAFARLHSLDTAAERSMRRPVRSATPAPASLGEAGRGEDTHRRSRVVGGLAVVAAVALVGLYLAFVRPGSTVPDEAPAVIGAVDDPGRPEPAPIRSDPRDILEQAAGELRDGHPASASELYERVLRLVPDQVEAWVGLGRAARELHQPAEALTYFERARSAAEANPDARWAFHLQQAARESAEILQLDRLRADAARAVRGRDTRGAIEAFRRYTAARPWDLEARREFGRALADGGFHDEAIEQLDAVVRLDPMQSESHLELARAWLALDRIEEAAAELETAVRLDPESDEARQALEAVRRRR